MVGNSWWSSIIGYTSLLSSLINKGIGHKIGTLDEGKDFDALLLNIGCSNPVFDSFDFTTEVGENQGVRKDTLEDKFQKFINLGDDRNILAVFVKGRNVKGN